MPTLAEILRIDESEEITVDAKSGAVTFPTRVQILKDALVFNAKTKGAVYVISEALKMSKEKTARLLYDASTEEYEIYFDGVACTGKSENDVMADVSHVIELAEAGIHTVYFCRFDYNEDGTCFYDATGYMGIRKLLSTYGLRAFRASLKERVILMRANDVFQKRLEGLRRFTLTQDGSTAFDLVLDGTAAFDRDEVLKYLSLCWFPAWESRTEGDAAGNEWKIELELEDETLEYTGLGAYPPTFPILEFLVRKYAL